MKCNSTDTRIISAYLRETWLKDQHHSTFTKLIRRASANHEHHRERYDNSGGNIAAARMRTRGFYASIRVNRSDMPVETIRRAAS